MTKNMEDKQTIVTKLKSMMNGQIRMDSKNVKKCTLFDTTKYKSQTLNQAVANAYLESNFR